MILDLKHLLETAEGLNSPIIELNNIAIEGKSSFRHVGDLSNILVLIREARGHANYQEVKNKLDNMFYGDFLSNFDMIGYLNEIGNQFDESLEKFNSLLPAGYLNQDRQAPDFLKLSPAEVNDRIEELGNAINEVYLLTEDIKILMDIHFFVSNIQKVFTDIPNDIVTALNNFKSEKKAIWPQLSIICNRAKLDLMDDYLVQKKEMTKLFDKYLSK
jgi:hypothetical protein